MSSLRTPRSWIVPVAFLLLALFFWATRIHDRDLLPVPSPSGAKAVELTRYAPDLHGEHLQMAEVAFGRLAAGDLPTWNPHQFCGTPLLAIPYVGIFYPLNAVYLLWDVPVATEVSFLLHSVIGMLGVWAVARRFGITVLGASLAAITFEWSAFVVLKGVQPSLFSAINLMPLTLLAIDRILAGRRGGLVALAAVVGGILLNGAAEILLHALYFGGLYAAARMLEAARAGDAATAVRRGAVVALGVGLGLALAAAQLFPTLELSRSTPSASLTLEQVLDSGRIWPLNFFRQALASVGLQNVGLLPLVLAPMSIGFRRDRAAWLVCAIVAVASMQLVFGHSLFELYYHTPLGGLFRRPLKFLDIYAFSQALLVGMSISSLQEMARGPARASLAWAGWMTSLVLTIYAIGWLSSLDLSNPLLYAIALLLVVFAVPVQRLRIGVVGALCLVQLESLFATAPDLGVRLTENPQLYTVRRAVIDELKQNLDGRRVYLSRAFMLNPGLTAKSAMLYEIPAVVGHDRLAGDRYAELFEYVSGVEERTFTGPYWLDDGSKYGLLDLLGTRYYLIKQGEPADEHMSASRAFRLVREQPPLRVFERDSALPRAWVVGASRTVDRDDVLEALGAADFDPREEVIFEPGDDDGSPGTGGGSGGSASIVESLPETLVVSATSDGPGYLVVSDLYFPGWSASVDGQPAPIHRANFLLRAVEIPSGTSRVELRYAPRSATAGIVVSGATLLLLVGLTVAARAREPRG